MTQTLNASRQTPILEVRNLTVDISARGKVLRALDGVDFSIAEGEILGMVGESGAGKSMTGQALIGLLPPGARITSGELWLEGRRIDNLPERERERLRGKSIGAIFQDPLTSLDPLMKVGEQLVETIRAHRPEMTHAAAKARAVELLRETGIPSPEVRAEQYPHQFSGGMRQRVVIALALAADPKLIIADEPTTALDVSIQAQIISLLKLLAHEHGASIMLITHDMGVIAETADRVAVLYSGEIVEIGSVADVISRPQHPYTKGLMGSIPDISAPGLWLEQIEGSMPDLADRPKGCPFHPRCRAAMEKCREMRPPLAPMGTSDAACWLASPTGNAVPDSLVRFHPKRRDLGREAQKRASELPHAEEILALKSLSCTFDVSAPFLTRLISRLPRQEVKAVSGVSFQIRRGETLALVGESGCGKSTLARLLAGLYRPTSGSIDFDGFLETPQEKTDFQRDIAGRLNMIFQDPYASLNPRMRIADIIAEPLETLHPEWSKDAVEKRVRESAELVRLPESALSKFPHQFSGGQRQRISIARALAARPEFLICDEPTSALDVSVQAQVLNLMKELQLEFGITYLFISHNLAVVHHMSDRVGVMYLGKLVELASRDDLFKDPKHPYSRMLLDAIPHLKETGRARTPVQGEVPSPLNPPSGCAFHPRCPRATEICCTQTPEFKGIPIAAEGCGEAHPDAKRFCACHHPL